MAKSGAHRPFRFPQAECLQLAPQASMKPDIAGTGNMVAGRDVISMRASPIIAARWFLASLTGLLVLACFGLGESRAADEVRPPVAIQFSLDRPIDASAAPFVMASASGLFGSEGLAVTTNIASGSAGRDCARRQRATSDFALVDINALIRFRDKTSSAPPIKAVFVLFNQGALRHHRPQEPRHPCALRHRGQDISASPKAIFRSGCGRRWRGRTGSRSQA